VAAGWPHREISFMRSASALGSLVALGFVGYALFSFASITDALRPGSKFNDPPTKPLAESAPEVAAIRGDLRRLAMDALAVAPLCVNRHPEKELPRPRGRVLIWDVEENAVSDAHGCLPPELRLQSGDQPCTVYLITERERTHSLDYEFGFLSGGGDAGVKGFRIDLVVCVVDLPSGQPRGRYEIGGAGPPSITELPPGATEIDENWGANLKRWIDRCVSGGEPIRVAAKDQAMYRQADAARDVIDECEQLGSLPLLANFPREVTLYNPQTDAWHLASNHVVGLASYQAESRLMILPLEEMLTIDRQRRSGRIDTRLALVSFPGAQPLGVYGVRGEFWPLPGNGNESWSDERNERHPQYELVRWVHALLRTKAGLPEGTIAIRPDASRLADTDWLQGPGWKVQK
jgi:hypothetical protein